jgi:hypothetical protein
MMNFTSTLRLGLLEASSAAPERPSPDHQPHSLLIAQRNPNPRQSLPDSATTHAQGTLGKMSSPTRISGK